MNQPSPAIIAQSAVRRLPRLALLLFCAAYVLPGFVGRGPWKNADISAFGVMQDLVAGMVGWWEPLIPGQSGGYDSLAPFWLGALAIKALPFLDPALAARLPFGLLLVLTLVATWYATYYLARSPLAQPVAFAFGGEASPVDYARAVADGGVLALIACLGLAQLSHETTPALAQLGFTALLLYSLSAGPQGTSGFRVALNGGLLLLGMAGLALSGAPAVALLFGLGALLIEALQRGRTAEMTPSRRPWMLWLLLVTVGVALLAYAMQLWHWRIDLSGLSRTASQKQGGAMFRLFMWFLWPAWPLALWTLFRWRRQLLSRHVALPLWFASVAVVSTLVTSASDRALLLSLPALAVLAAFALPTLQRSVASLIDWFTLLFFTACGITIWVVWLSLQTGVPKQPALNVARLAPGFEPSFSAFAFGAALAATLAWAWLVQWRAGRHRAAVWKTLVLPAAGTTLCWLLLMTLWLPLLDYARSYAPQAKQIAKLVNPQACVLVHGLSSGQATALRYHAGLTLKTAQPGLVCPFMVVDADARGNVRRQTNMSQWQVVGMVSRPTDRNDNMVVFRRAPTAPGTAPQTAPAPEQAAPAQQPSAPP